MVNIDKFIDELGLKEHLTLDDIPDIDLYMDQVIQLFEKKYAKTKRDPKDKILTKTMINNYAKGRLFFPIKNKKYSKEHLLLISFIYQLKGTITINDIKVVLEKLNDKVLNENFTLDDLYKAHTNLIFNQEERFKKDFKGKVKEVTEATNQLADSDSEYLKQLLLILSLSHMSTLYQRAAEKLIDEFQQEEEEN
jgi:DNA-binding transcriptional MerR regulator